MADVSTIIGEMRGNPQNVRFESACRVADAYFGKPRQKGTSHRIWKMPWAGDPRVNLQQGGGGKAKAYQIEQLLKSIDRLETERAAAQKIEAPKQASGKRKKKR